MPSKNQDLHGNVPDQCDLALILIDVINDMDFDGGEALLEHALPAAKHLAALVRRARDCGVPIIYVNDNFGKWRSDFRAQLSHVLEDGVRGAPIARLLCPSADDYVVLKAKHSGFYHTQLDLLIDYLDAKTIILTGFATDSCVLFTAADAHMRDLQVIVPPDCVAARSATEHQQALDLMTRVLEIQALPSDQIDLTDLVEHGEHHEPQSAG